MISNKTEKLKKLREASKLDNQNAKWKEIAKWNQIHKDALDDYTIIAFRILECLKEKGLTQRQLAKELGVTPQALTKIVKGRRNLTLNTIRKIEKVLDIQLISVLHEENSNLKSVIACTVKMVPVVVYSQRKIVTQNKTDIQKLINSKSEIDKNVLKSA